MRNLLFFIFLISFHLGYTQSSIPELVETYCTDTCYINTFIIGSINNQLMVGVSKSSLSSAHTDNVHIYGPDGLLRIDNLGKEFPNPYIRPIVYNNTFYYWSKNDTQYKLCSWDGIKPPTVLAAHETPGTILVHNDKLYYNAVDTGLRAFCIYDLSAQTEKKIYNIYSVNGIIYKNNIYFTLLDDSIGYELFTFDPEHEKFTLVADINPGPASGNPRLFTIAENKLYFAAQAENKLSSLYMFDEQHQPIKLVSFGTVPAAPILNPVIAQIIPKDDNFYIHVSQIDTSYFRIYKYHIPENSLASITYKYWEFQTRNSIYYRDKIFYNAHDSIINWPIKSHINTFHTQKETTSILPNPKELNFNWMDDNILYDDAVYYLCPTPSLNGLFKYYEAPPYTPASTLYPNPATNTVSIKTALNENNVLTLVMHDATGREVMQQRLGIYSKGNHTIEIPLQHLAAGMYICTLRGSKNILFKGKLVKL